MADVNYETLTRPFPQEAIRQRKGANGQLLVDCPPASFSGDKR